MAILLIVLGLWIVVGPWPKSLELAVVYSFSQHKGLAVSDLIGFMLVIYGLLPFIKKIAQKRNLKKE